MAEITADLDTAIALAQGLPAKIAAAQELAVSTAAVPIAPKVAELLSSLQATDAALTPAPVPVVDPVETVSAG